MTRDQKIAEVKRRQKIEQVRQRQAEMLASQSQEQDASAQAEIAQVADQAQKLDALDTGFRSGFETATLGFSEPVISAANAVGDVIGDAIYGTNSSGARGQGVLSQLAGAYDKDVARRRENIAAHQTADIVGRVGGALVPGGVGVLGAGAKAAVGSGNLARGLVSALPGGTTALGRIAGSAAAGGAATAATEIPRRIVLGQTGFIEPQDQMASVTDMVKGGATFGGGLGALGEVGRAAGKLAPKVLGMFTGPKEKAIRDYAKNVDRLRGKRFDEQAVKAEQQIQKIAGDLKNKATQAGLDTADELQVALNQLKGVVGEESAKAREIIANANLAVPVDDLTNIIAKRAGEIRTVGGRVMSESGRVAQAKLQGLGQELAALKNEGVEALSGPDLKNFIQALDDEYEVLASAGQFGSLPGRLLKGVRADVDGVLKSVEPYREQMKKVSNLTKLLDETSRRFGTQEKALAALQTAGTNKQPIRGSLLGDLAEVRGVNLERATQARDAATQFGRLEGDSQAANFVKQFLRSDNRVIREQAKQLSKLGDQDLVQALDDLRMLSPFEGEFRIGSRNVLLGGSITAALTGFSPAILVGAVAGAAADKYGPQMARKAIETFATIQGVPTVQKVQQAFANLPPDVRQKAVMQVTRAYTQTADRTPIFVPEADRPTMIRDIMSTDMPNIKKARAVNQLNKDGMVDAQVMDRVGLSGKPKPSMAEQIMYNQQ